MTTRKVDFIEQGDGPTVVLIHSSVAGARQWRSLMDARTNRFHLNAINLYGYRETGELIGDQAQTLHDQARLLDVIIPSGGCEFSPVGHSFGGSVAMKAASLFRDQLHRFALIEPKPFHLLEQGGRLGGFEEAGSLANCIKESGRKNEWDAVMNENIPQTEWAATLPRRTTVVSAAETVRSIKGIVDLMR